MSEEPSRSHNWVRYCLHHSFLISSSWGGLAKDPSTVFETIDSLRFRIQRIYRSIVLFQEVENLLIGVHCGALNMRTILNTDLSLPSSPGKLTRILATVITPASSSSIITLPNQPKSHMDLEQK